MQNPLSIPPSSSVPASDALTANPPERNTLAIVALIASLIFPSAFASTMLSLVAHLNNWPLAVTTFFAIFGSMIGILSIPGMICAIACGHVALHRAKLYTKPYARRGMAIISLIIGYLSLAFFLGTIAIFLIAGFNAH